MVFFEIIMVVKPHSSKNDHDETVFIKQYIYSPSSKSSHTAKLCIWIFGWESIRPENMSVFLWFSGNWVD